MVKARVEFAGGGSVVVCGVSTRQGAARKARKLAPQLGKVTKITQWDPVSNSWTSCYFNGFR